MSQTPAIEGLRELILYNRNMINRLRVLKENGIIRARIHNLEMDNRRIENSIEILEKAEV